MVFEMNKGLVVKSISGEYTVYDNGNYIVCKPRGLFRHKDETIKVPRDFQVFSSTTIQKHQFLGTQPSLWSNSDIRA